MQKISNILDKIDKGTTDLEFLKTGFPTIDEQLDGGFMRKELIVIGAKTGFGKSFIAGQLMLNIARARYSTAYFSLEISNEMVVSRLAGSIANIKPTRIRAGLLSLEELGRKNSAENELRSYEDLMSFSDDLYQLQEIVEEIKENHYDFVVIDFVQNIFAKAQDDVAKLNQISLDLQKLAKEENCCILLLSQFSTAVQKESLTSPDIHYKGSGGIKTACDLGFMLHREPYVEGQTYQDIHLILNKNRRGVSGLTFDLLYRHPGGEIIERLDDSYPNTPVRM